MPTNIGGFLHTVPGTISRAVDDIVVSLRNAGSTDINPGDAVFLKNDSNGPGVTRVQTDSTFAGFVGIAVRVPSRAGDTSGSNDPAPWKSGEPVDVLVRGCVSVAVDDADLAAVLERLDRIIALLSPAPAADEDPVEEIAEAVEEALEAAAEEAAEALLTEAAEPGIAEEIAEIVEEIVEAAPASTVLSPEEDETCRDPRETGDALRAALRLKKAALAKLPKRERLRLSRDVAARVSGKTRGSAVSVYGALSAARDTKAPRDDDADLGKRIMASRNVNCHKK